MTTDELPRRSGMDKRFDEDAYIDPDEAIILDEPISDQWDEHAGDELAEKLRLEPIERLKRDLKDSAAMLTRREVRYLVDTYYTVQRYRIAANNQARAIAEADEPVRLIAWVFGQMEVFEGQLKLALNHYAKHEPTGMGAWAMETVGIGPVISSGLLAHIDISRVNTAGQIWRFAGLDPTVTWDKGERRPWNADLKKLCFLIGESFVKVQNRDGDFYGHKYAERKKYEIERNERGDMAETAALTLASKNYGEHTDARAWYLQGKLPPARIHARARRWAVKLFLAHWFEEAYRRHYKTEPPLPYPIAHMGHAHIIKAPH